MSNYHPFNPEPNNNGKISNRISIPTSQRDDQCYVETRTNTNRNFSDYNVTNYRNQWKCGQKQFNTFNPIYNNQGIRNGNGLDCYVDTSSALLHSQLLSKPVDKLQEMVNEERYYDYFPKTSGMQNITSQGICKKSFVSNQCDILTSTTAAPNPQKGYNPLFDRIGSNTRNFSRRNEVYYKKMKAPLNVMQNIGSHGRYTKLN